MQRARPRHLRSRRLRAGAGAPRAASIAALAWALALGAGCDEPARTARPGTGTTRTAVEPAPPATPEAAPEPLALPVAPEGEDRETCAARLRASTPPEVRATLVDLGWIDFYGDACGAAIAIRDRTPAGCDELSARSLRERCRMRIAVASAEPSTCPPATAGEGHDPLCVALASGLAGLCRGVSIPLRPSCRALLAADPELCAASPASEARCRAEVGELAPLLAARLRADEVAGEAAGGVARSGEPAEPELVLEVRRVVPSGGGEVVSEPTTIRIESLERGAVLLTEDGALRVVAGESSPARASAPSALLELELPGEAGEGGELSATLALGTEARLELRLPDLGPLAGGRGEIRVRTLEPRLGGRFEGTLEAELLAGVGSVRVTGRFVTFVRDRTP